MLKKQYKFSLDRNTQARLQNRHNLHNPITRLRKARSQLGSIHDDQINEHG